MFNSVLTLAGADASSQPSRLCCARLQGQLVQFDITFNFKFEFDVNNEVCPFGLESNNYSHGFG